MSSSERQLFGSKGCLSKMIDTVEEVISTWKPKAMWNFALTRKVKRTVKKVTILQLMLQLLLLQELKRLIRILLFQLLLLNMLLRGPVLIRLVVPDCVVYNLFYFYFFCNTFWNFFLFFLFFYLSLVIPHSLPASMVQYISYSMQMLVIFSRTCNVSVVLIQLNLMNLVSYILQCVIMTHPILQYLIIPTFENIIMYL